MQNTCRFDNVLNAASNYWSNSSELNRNRKPIVSYNINPKNQLI